MQSDFNDKNAFWKINKKYLQPILGPEYLLFTVSVLQFPYCNTVSVNCITENVKNVKSYGNCKNIFEILQ